MPLALIILYSSTIAATGLIGLFVLFQDRFSMSNRSFFGFAFFQVFWILSLFFTYQNVASRPPNLVQSEFFVDLAYGFGLIMMLFLIFFLYHFPRPIVKFGKIKSWIYVSVMVIMGVLAGFTELVHDAQLIRDGVYLADSYGPLYGVYSILLLATLLLATFIATKKSVMLKGLEKKKMAYTTIGIWFFTITTITTNLILPLHSLNFLGGINLIQISPAYTLFFVVPTFYSIYKHRFFNFSYVSSRVFRALISSGFFLLATLAFYMLLLNIAPRLSIFGMIGVSALLAYLMSQRLQAYIPEFVSGELREFRRIVTEFKTNILSVDSLRDLQTSIENNFVVQLNFVNAKVYVIRESKDNFDLPVYQKNAFTRVLNDYRHDVLVKGEIAFGKKEEAEKQKLIGAMTKLDADLVVPLFSERNLIGFFALKKKGEDTVYSKEEIDELEGLKRRLEVALMNVLLKLNLEEENNLMKKIINTKTRQLKKKIHEINELLKQQADFIAVTAHEFRTPLTIASFQVDNLRHSKKKRSTKELVKELKMVEESIGNIKTLTEKLFKVQQYDLNKVELHPEKTDINEFVERLFKDFVPIMKKKKLHFEFKKKTHKKIFAKVDNAQFRQVLHNLLTNASKFTPKDGLVTLGLHDGEKAGQFEIRVEDNGSGIPDDLKKSIFEKFRTKAAGAGIGLGLYLCKKIIELHKGKLWVQDSSLGGASFRIRLSSVKA